MMENSENTIFPKPFYFMVFKVLTTEDRLKGEIVKNLFSNDVSGFKNFLETQKGFRFAGWDLQINGGYKVDLEGIENSNRLKRIRVLSNGSLIIQGAIIHDFLCWGNENDRIHTLGLIEFTYNGVDTLKKMLEFIDNPQKVEYAAGFVGLDKSQHFIVPGDITSTFPSRDKKYLTNSEAQFSGVFNDLQETTGKLTYEITEKVYRMFGLTQESIPYVSSDESGPAYIDVNKIKEVRS